MIGIYGGTFNPVHYGHLRTALEIKQSLNLTEVRLLPCALPAHRQAPEVSAALRAHMLKLAIADSPELQLDTRELDRPGPSYMIDTLRAIKAEQPQVALALIIGQDAFAGLPSWREWQALFDYAHIIVMSRPGYQTCALADFFQQRLIADSRLLASQPAGFLWFQPVSLLAISASQIRQLLAENANPQFLLPEPVLAFIRKQGLYRSDCST